MSVSKVAVREAKPGLLQRYVPILHWLPTYRHDWFAPDTVAALSVWALLIPQSLGYAGLVGTIKELPILFVDIIHGILIGVVLSLLLVARASKPGMRRLGRDPKADVLVDTDGADIVIQIARELGSQGISLAVAHLEHSIGELWTRADAIDATRPATPAATHSHE